MEYPTFVTAGTESVFGLGSAAVQTGWVRGLELVIVHEIGHQWFQSMVATNEAEEPWLDEGFTDYSTVRAMSASYGTQSSAFQAGDFQAGYLDLRRMEYLSAPDEPMYGKAWDFNMLQYGVASYSKPALALTTLQRVLGEETMFKVMSTYFTRYRFAHPTTQDFEQVARQVSGQDLSWFFGDPLQHTGLVYGSGTLNYVAKGIAPRSITVERDGALIIPTEILVTFTDGQKQTIPWDGMQADTTFPFDREVQSYVIDPGRKLAIEMIWSDNGLARHPDAPAFLTLFTRLLYHLQDWLLFLGGI